MPDLSAITPSHRSRTVASRIDVDIATGILVAVRSISPDAANAELVACAVANHLSLFQLSRALITLASDGVPSASDSPAARSVAELEWGGALASRSLAQPGLASTA
ncbi:ANTAR domain-containing protein [Actinomycetes bacterium M1A6_2h]